MLFPNESAIDTRVDQNSHKSMKFGRTQCVVLDGVSSPRCSVLSGVPQGTVLSTTLSCIYINDLPETILHSSVKLFADDCILYRAVYTPADTEKLQEDLYTLQDWQHKWLMRLNTSKCFAMSISHPRRNKIISSYKIHDTFCLLSNITNI